MLNVRFYFFFPHAFVRSFISCQTNQINPSHNDQEVVMLLLHYDACAAVINGSAQIPKDVTQNAEIRSMLEGERCILSVTMETCSQSFFFTPACLSSIHTIYAAYILHFLPSRGGCQLPKEQKRGNWRRNFWRLRGKETYRLSVSWLVKVAPHIRPDAHRAEARVLHVFVRL